MAVVVSRARCLLAGILVAGGALFASSPARATPLAFNGRITFTHNGGAALDTTGIYTINPDGTGLQQLTHGEGYSSSYRGDGSQIAYQAVAGVAVMNADGTNPATVLPGEHAAIRLSWSRDGTKFTWMESVNGAQPVITVENADGTDRHHVLDDGGSRWYPTWSPDGTQIAFWDAGSDAHIGIVNADGSNEHSVVAVAHSPDFVSFSPSGTQLVYSEETDDLSAYVLHIVNVDGTDDRIVGDLTGASSLATWSPDGQWIAYVRGGDGSDHGLWIVRADGTGARQLTRGEDIFPNWQPLASAPANLPPRAFGTAQNKQSLALFANGDASWDFDGSIVSYEWRWGDSTAMTPHKYAWHKYAHAGTYLVRLTVTDDDGAKTTKKAWVKVA